MKKYSILITTALFMALSFGFNACKEESEQTVTTIYYSLVFDSKGGSSVETQKIAAGKSGEEPEDPVKNDDSGQNYFGGWYTDEGFTNKYDFTTPLTKDTILYARWLSIPEGSFLVTFESNCDTDIENQIVEEGKCASKPEEALTKDGYAFCHWHLSGSDEEFDFENTAITATTELEAKWNRSGIYEADFEDSSLYCINIYESLTASSESGAW